MVIEIISTIANVAMVVDIMRRHHIDKKQIKQNKKKYIVIVPNKLPKENRCEKVYLPPNIR
jgi:hypothetical protein